MDNGLKKKAQQLLKVVEPFFVPLSILLIFKALRHFLLKNLAQ
jgi:hypothetical protein